MKYNITGHRHNFEKIFADEVFPLLRLSLNW